MPLSWKDIDDLLAYCPTTGNLIYKVSKRGRIQKGMVAGTWTKDGYISVTIKGERHRAHKVVWALVKKERPPDLIDHKNGIKSCNLIDNLRDATKSQNGANSKLSSNNTTGIRNVYFVEKTGKWVVKVMQNRKSISGGTFDNIAEAEASAIKLHKQLFGEFSYG